MPSSYAHYRMGQDVRKRVDKNARRIIEAYPELYLIGLHGPDILFYYKPLGKNIVNQTGYRMHAKSGKEFFVRAGEMLKHHAGQEAYLSYLYGFICHFSLDVTCHGYIAEKMQTSGLSHAEIEVEFDRELLIKDGYNPVCQKLTTHIVPSKENAEVIKDFYQGISCEQTRKALKGMIFYTNFLVAPSKVKRNFIYSGLKLAGCYEGMKGQIVNYEKNPICADSTAKLFRLYTNAKALAGQLIGEYPTFLIKEQPLNEIYEYTFAGVLPQSNTAKRSG